MLSIWWKCFNVSITFKMNSLPWYLWTFMIRCLPVSLDTPSAIHNHIYSFKFYYLSNRCNFCWIIRSNKVPGLVLGCVQKEAVSPLEKLRVQCRETDTHHLGATVVETEVHPALTGGHNRHCSQSHTCSSLGSCHTIGTFPHKSTCWVLEFICTCSFLFLEFFLNNHIYPWKFLLKCHLQGVLATTTPPKPA